jgi:hypothetical protein
MGKTLKKSRALKPETVPKTDRDVNPFWFWLLVELEEGAEAEFVGRDDGRGGGSRNACGIMICICICIYLYILYMWGWSQFF